MIRYRLRCAKGHEFEAWFSNSAAYDKQAKRSLVECPDCGSKKVEKAMMAPAVAAKSNRRSEAAAPANAETMTNALPPEVAAHLAMRRDLLTMMRKAREEVLAKAENVGDRFAEEARKIHYNEADARGIYGQASPDEARALVEEGIDVHPLPSLPDDHN